MSSQTLFKLSGLALLIGGALGALAVAFHPANMADPANIPVHVALYTAVVLVALGLPGFYAKQAQHTGLPGLLGFLALFFGVLFADPIHSVLEFTVIPVIAADPALQPLLDGPPPGLMGPLMIFVPVLLLGLLITAIVSLRAGVFPRWPAVVALAAVVLVPLGIAVTGDSTESIVSEVGPALLYLSMAAFGYVLLVQRESMGTAVVRSASQSHEQHLAAMP